MITGLTVLRKIPTNDNYLGVYISTGIIIFFVGNGRRLRLFVLISRSVLDIEIRIIITSWSDLASEEDRKGSITRILCK